jgi:putative holliday junction resolvase
MVSDYMRIMCLDVGSKRVGVAVSDPLGWTAQGIKTVIRQENSNNDILEIKKIISDYKVEKIVIGLPKNMNNTIGPQGEKVMEYAKVIEHKCKRPIVFFDERLSTMAVERTLIEADVSRKKRKTVIDKLAAVYILQSYLDSPGKI